MKIDYPIFGVYLILYSTNFRTLKNFSKQYEKDDADPQDNEDLKNFLSTKQDDKPPLYLEE